MNITVLIKQIPSVEELRFDERGNMMRDGVPSVLNPLDEFALEAALRLKESSGGAVTVLTMGPPQAEETLRYCLSKGADAAVLVTDRAFKGADTLATARALAAAAARLSAETPVDLLLCGRNSDDSDTGHVPAQTAAFLGWPDLPCALTLEASGGKLIFTRAIGPATQQGELSLPAVVSMEKKANEPRLPSIKGKLKSRSAQVRRLTAADIGLPASDCGSAGSPTTVTRCFLPEAEAAAAAGAQKTAATIADLTAAAREGGLL